MPKTMINGHSIFYREQGAGKLLMILPGNTASSACHQQELSYFSQHFRVVAIDPWGTGRSERRKDWTTDWWAQLGCDAISLAAHLGDEKVILMGTSGGAAAALIAASEFPAIVEAVIADSVCPYAQPDRLCREVENRQQKETGSASFWKLSHGEDWEAVVEEDNNLLLKFANSGGVFIDEQLKNIQCPTLLTAGLDDPLLYEVSRQITQTAAQIPNCQVFLVNKGGHPLMWSRPDEFRRAVDAFFLGLGLMPKI